MARRLHPLPFTSKCHWFQKNALCCAIIIVNGSSSILCSFRRTLELAASSIFVKSSPSLTDNVLYKSITTNINSTQHREKPSKCVCMCCVFFQFVQSLNISSYLLRNNHSLNTKLNKIQCDGEPSYCLRVCIWVFPNISEKRT